MYCKNCGEKLPEDAKFCASCGEKVESPSLEKEENTEPVQEVKETVNVAYAAPPVQNKKKSSAGLIIGIVVGIVAFLGLATVGGLIILGLLVERENPTEPIGDIDEPYSQTISNETIDVKFGKYVVEIPAGVDYDYNDKGVIFEKDGNYYEIAIIQQNFNVLKENREVFVGKEDGTGADKITFDSVDVKTKDNKEYLLIYGTYGIQDMITLLTTTSSIPGYTVTVSCYGPSITEKESFEVSIPVIESLNIFRSESSEDLVLNRFGFIENIVWEDIEITEE